MSWHYLRELEGESLEDICSGGEPLQPLKSKITHAEFYCNGKLMDCYLDSLSGTTLEPLMENLGQEKSMSSQVDFLAKTFQPQEKAMDSMESEAECGEKWHGWLAKYDHSTSSWKTPQCSLLEEELESLATLPKWGMTVNGLLWEQPMLEPITKGTGCGFLPTPNARDWKDTDKSGNRKSPGLGVVAHWPTPRTKGMCGGSGSWDLLKKNTTIEEARLMGAGNGGKLNPMWVEKLMGWPTDWTCINNISHTKMMFWVMGFYDDKERCTNQILQMLRQGNVSKEVQQQIGRPVDILETAVLLAQLCEYSDRHNEARILFSCQEVLEKEMRGLRSQQETSSSSHRSKHQEQLGEQHSDTMQALSRLLAYHGKEAWKNNSWEDAIPRVGKDIIARADRLKAIGNGQVPLCAATAWRILK